MSAMKQFMIEKLDIQNYPTWCKQMTYYLKLQGLWQYVSPEAGKVASEGDASTSAAKNDEALAIIGLLVKEHHLPLLDTCKTAKEAWAALAAWNKADANSNWMLHKRALNNLRKGADESLTMYVSRASSIMGDLKSAGRPVDETEVTLSMLLGLNDDYSAIVTFLTAGGGQLTLSGVLPQLMAIEARLKATEHRESDTTAAFMMMKNKSNKACWNCGKTGHLRSQCRALMQNMQGTNGNLNNYPAAAAALRNRRNTAIVL
jgi:hypothetical protein